MADESKSVVSPLAACGLVLVAVCLVGAFRGAPAETTSPTERGMVRREPPTPGRTEAEALLDGARMDLNRARADELALLPCIGPTLAARIVAYRRRHGPFRRVEELDAVRGVGPRTIDSLRRWVNVTHP